MADVMWVEVTQDRKKAGRLIGRLVEGEMAGTVVFLNFKYDPFSIKEGEFLIVEAEKRAEGCFHAKPMRVRPQGLEPIIVSMSFPGPFQEAMIAYEEWRIEKITEIRKSMQGFIELGYRIEGRFPPYTVWRKGSGEVQEDESLPFFAGAFGIDKRAICIVPKKDGSALLEVH
ncbi:MAG: hypothetical protein ISS93_02785 [Candidatus Aenigmarchaeota archaeon]|nr:hypothetical protein [Candidatus Aenigmarchaeota archaeon]